MITFEYQAPCEVGLYLKHKQWLKAIVRNEGKSPGNIQFMFCDDDYLLERNIQFLNHETLTDIITFDDNMDDLVAGEIMISLQRVEENAHQFGVLYENELYRVMAHGVLHLCGYKDKTEVDSKQMRAKEGEALELYFDKYKQ